MRYAFRYAGICLALAMLPLAMVAQKDLKKYREEADEIRKEIWAWTRPEFKLRSIPEEYNKSSRVIMARHVEINNELDKKFFSGTSKFTGMEILREMIRLADKSAVSDFSEFSYDQLQRTSQFFVDATTTSFVGVRVIKKDGTIKEIQAEDIVLTKNSSKEKEAKLAIPDLVPGDIIDYFIAKKSKGLEKAENANKAESYTFELYDANPVLHYSIHCSFDSRYAVEYHAYNGAPEFKESRNSGEGIVLDLTVKNISPLGNNNIWISAARQLPMIRMNVIQGVKTRLVDLHKVAGTIYKDKLKEASLKDEKKFIDGLAQLGGPSIYFMDQVTRDYFIEKLKRGKNMHPDSLAAELFYMNRFYRFLHFELTQPTSGLKKFNDGRINPSAYILYTSMLMKTHGVKNDLLLLTSRYAPRIEEVISKDDFTYMMVLRGNKPIIMGATDMFSPAFYIPSHYEGTKQAILLNGARGDESMDVPVSAASQNMHLEQLRIRPELQAGTLQVSRKTVLTGHYRSDTQKELILFEDYFESERKHFNQEKPVVDFLLGGKRSKGAGEELKAVFDEERRKQKDKFLEEAKGEFNQEITNLTDHKILNLGVRHTAPDFIYSSNFQMGGVVKKAGNNYILEVGKLQGNPLKIDEDQRKRKLDVYAPFARTIQYEIMLELPEGYTAEGVESLNKKVENNTGSFIVEAAAKGTTIAINVRKTYNNGYEPSSNWASMLAFIDAANEWSNAKLLLKKK